MYFDWIWMYYDILWFTIEFSPKWNEKLVNLGNLTNHWDMHRDQFKDLVGYKCVAGTVVTSQSFTQEVSGSNNLFKHIIFFPWIQWQHLGKTQIPYFLFVSMSLPFSQMTGQKSSVFLQKTGGLWSSYQKSSTNFTLWSSKHLLDNLWMSRSE